MDEVQITNRELLGPRERGSDTSTSYTTAYPWTLTLLSAKKIQCL
jgi:hypothetical protein